MIEGVDFFVRLVPFPSGARIHAMLALNDDGTYSVYLDSNSPLETQKTAMKHEYAHMAADDMYGTADIRTVERL